MSPRIWRYGRPRTEPSTGSPKGAEDFIGRWRFLTGAARIGPRLRLWGQDQIARLQSRRVVVVNFDPRHSINRHSRASMRRAELRLFYHCAIDVGIAENKTSSTVTPWRNAPRPMALREDRNAFRNIATGETHWSWPRSSTTEPHARRTGSHRGRSTTCLRSRAFRLQSR
jgi:hypothetical protein